MILDGFDDVLDHVRRIDGRKPASEIKEREKVAWFNNLNRRIIAFLSEHELIDTQRCVSCLTAEPSLSCQAVP
jgi:hypothetical protein